MSELLRDIEFIKGVGKKRAQLFKKRLGLFTLGDLLTFYPKRYEDLSNPTKISNAAIDENICIKAKICTDIFPKVSYNKKITTYSFDIYDRTGKIKVVIFNNKYLANSLAKNEEYLFFGKVKYNGIFKEMNSPEILPVTEQKIKPIYKATSGLSSRTIERIMKNAVTLLEDREFIPENICKKYNLISHFDAIKQIHFPSDKTMLERAIERLSFEELFLLRLGFYGLKSRNRGFSAKPITPLKREEYTSLFPFELTLSQQKVINECLRDMSKNIPMNRLVQGDVGSGKTAVAAALCYTVYKNGFMCVMLAPTEILALQHHKTLSNLFKGKNINVELLTGSLSAKSKKAVKENIVNGNVNILVATHAVLTDDTKLPNTALVITDEQHRFGVVQRAVLSKKANSPHTLVMSATPIPRTMGLTIYGDLDISIISELPKGRIPIESFAIDESLRNRALGYVKKHLDKGYQGYIICPMVEETEDNPNTNLNSVTEYAEKLKDGMFKDYSLGVLHGKMKPKDKENVMSEFAKDKIKLLIATTVVEVGVDVPNAVIMVIENAERFGLSQLHQLRGRVGRGSIKSTCIFIYSSKSKTSAERLKTITSTTDGFKIAEADLKLRGPGNFLGKEQHGLPNLKIADMINDIEILENAANAADAVLKDDPKLQKNENLLLKTKVNNLFSSGKNIEFN